MHVRISNFFSMICSGLLLVYAGQFLLLGADRLFFLTEFLILAMVPVLGLLAPVRAHRLTRPATLFASCLIGFVIMMWISTILHGNPGLRGAVPLALDVFLDVKLYILCFLLLIALRPDMLSCVIESVLTVLLIIALVNLPFVLRDSVLGGVSWNGVQIGERGGQNVPVGIFIHKVQSSNFMLLGLMSSLARSLETRGQRRRVYRTVALVFFVTTITHLSVKEMVGAVTILTLYLGLFLGNLQVRALLVILIIPMALIATLTTNNPISASIEDRYETFVGETSENTVRTRSYIGAVAIAQDMFPLGAGAATFMSRGAREVYSPYYYTTGIAFLHGGSEEDGQFLMDTFWPKIFAQAGFIGGGLYLFAIIQANFLALRLVRTDKSGTSFFATSTLIVYSLASLATPVFTHDYLVPVLALALAYVLAQPRSAMPRETSRETGIATPFAGSLRTRAQRPNKTT